MKDMNCDLIKNDVEFASLENELNNILASFDTNLTSSKGGSNMTQVNKIEEIEDDVFHYESNKKINLNSTLKSKFETAKTEIEEEQEFEKFIIENDKIGIEKNFAKWFEDLNLTPALEETMEDVEIPKTSSADIFAFSADYLNKNNNSASNQPILQGTSPKLLVSTKTVLLQRNISTDSSKSTGNKVNLQQLRSKHKNILRNRKNIYRSAPTSPTLTKKYSTIPSKEEKQLELQSTNHRSLQRGNRSKNRSSSLNKQSSQENFLVNNQSDSTYNTLGLKASSMRSLQLGRTNRRTGGSSLSLISIDSENYEDELKDYRENARRGRKNDVKIAQLEKERLQNIVNMCASLMNGTELKDDENYIPDKNTTEFKKPTPPTKPARKSISKLDINFQNNHSVSMNTSNKPPISPNSAKFSNNFSASPVSSTNSQLRRLQSFEDEVIKDSSATSSIFVDGIHELGDANRVQKKTYQSPLNRRQADLDEILRLRDINTKNLKIIQNDILHKEEEISESVREKNMEKDLLTAELNTEHKLLQKEELNCEKIKDKIMYQAEKYHEQRAKQQEIVSKEKNRLLEIESNVSSIKKQIDKCPESTRGSMEEKLNQEEENFREKSTNFEDLEFQALEICSKLDESHQDQEQILMKEKKLLQDCINMRKKKIASYEEQLMTLDEQHKKEYRKLNIDRDSMISKFQEQQKESALLEDKYYQITGKFPSPRKLSSSSLLSFTNHPLDDAHSPKSPNQMPSSPNSSNQEVGNILSSPILSTRPNSKAMPQNKIVSSNVKPTLKSPASPKSSNGEEKINNNETPCSPNFSSGSNKYLNRRKVGKYPSNNLLNHAINLGVYNPENKTWNDCMSIGSMDSLETSLSSHYTSVNSANHMDSMEKVRQMEKLIADATMVKRKLLREVQENEASKVSSPQKAVNVMSSTRNLSSPTNSVRVTSPVKLRHQPSNNDIPTSSTSASKRQNRPMTRFLPVMTANFDLRKHIEQQGHQPHMCNNTIITTTSCKGYLTKMGGTIKTWKRRWFVFDRINKTMHYYKNKHETKLRGAIPFQQIEDVFFDHLKTAKNSPDAPNTFCIKCRSRQYFVVAPTSVSMRIWMDVIWTGAQGYTDYMKTLEN